MPSPLAPSIIAAIRSNAEDTRSDSELIARAQRGDLEAYGVLVRRYQHDARRTAAAIGGPDLADDAAQDTFVRGYRSLARFRAGAPFRPWLLAIVANVARNQRRASNRWSRTAARVDEGRRDLGVVPSAEQSALLEGRRRDVWAALDALPERHREVVACRYLLDLTEEETAAVLDIPRGTVKSRLSRALDRLAHLLPREVHDG